MGELELVRLHEDGEHLILAGSDGTQYRLRITEQLGAAVRRDRARMEHLRAEGSSLLPPREIQARLRAGVELDDVVAASGLSTEAVRRYAGPVWAEQEYVILQARAWRNRGPSSPALDELADRRLRTRDVRPDSVRWSAARRGGEPWVVTAAFEVGGRARRARWTYDLPNRTLHALDDEARWLSQVEVDLDPNPGRVAVFDVDATPKLAAVPDRPITGPIRPDPDRTGALLDDLTQRRGVRPERARTRDDDPYPETEAGFDLDGLTDPSTWSRPGGNHPAGRRRPGEPAAEPPVEPRGEPRVEARVESRPGRDGADRRIVDLAERVRREDRRPTHSTTVLMGGESFDDVVRGPRSSAPDPVDDRSFERAPAAEPAAGPASGDAAPTESRGAAGSRRTNRRTRAKVPSLDEIVFGVKPRE